MTEPLDLEKLCAQVLLFQTMALPGQPRATHIGTSDLVQDLLKAALTLAEQLEQADRLIAHYCNCPADFEDQRPFKRAIERHAARKKQGDDNGAG